MYAIRKLLRCVALGLVLADFSAVTSAEDVVAPPPAQGWKSIQAISLKTDPPAGKLPGNDAHQMFHAAGEQWQLSGFSRSSYEMTFAWEAPAVAYRPLYFEDEQLERYGHHHGLLQPAFSAAHFFGRLPVIPYLRGATSPRSCQYSLGYYRPGDCVPYFIYRPKPSLRGAVYQAAAVSGAAIGLP